MRVIVAVEVVVVVKGTSAVVVVVGTILDVSVSVTFYRITKRVEKNISSSLGTIH